MPDREDGLLASRYSKLDHLRQSGIDPYPPRFVRTCDNAAATAMFEAVESDDTPETTTPSISLGGRIMSMRVMGRAAFLDIRDGSGTIQALLRENVLGDAYGLLKDLDLGDHLGVSGPVMRTRTGQVTIEAHELTITSKGMKPLPEKFHGLRDTETRYRQRYLDLIANPEVMPVFATRSKIIERIRAFFQSQGFLEVDTPILVPVAGGAHARPFITHHNTLDQQLYLRIATELYLKRLIIGGFDKVYELGRVFRNEGIDQDHNPEFTLLESYQAYADYNDIMTMVESLVSTVAMEVLGTTHVQYGDQLIDFAPPWKRVDFRQELKDLSGVDIDAYTDDESLKHRAAELGLDIEPKDGRAKVIDKLFSSYVEPRLAQPTFVLDYPVIMSPLAKAKPDSPGYVERFEAFAAGMEIANSYTELNDPAVQRERFENQEALRLMLGDDETDRLDEDFLIALEYGMPPTGGLGMGIDRLVMLLAGQTSIRDIMLFPQMRTLQPGQEEESE
ncbi:MAG: lysine--tRNA ligase [Dehalococcoidia bacterium]|nr:lysine--tRNA ligase [Dehalococcoidia bacterium]